MRIIETLEPFLLLTLGLIKFSQIGFSLVGVGRGGAENLRLVWRNACCAAKLKAGKFYHVDSYITNQLSPRHKPSLTPLWMTVCWFCSLLFTSVEFAHQRKLSTQKYSRWTQKEWENTVKCQLREKFVLCTQEFVKGFVQAKGNHIYELQLIHTRHEVTQDLLCSS